MTNTSIPLFKVFVSKDVIDPLAEALMSGYIGQGPKVEEFEDLLRKHFNVDYVNTVNSCTAALHIAVRLTKASFDMSADDEILTTPLTCTATNFAILANGVKLRWVDVDPFSGNLDLDDLERKLSPKTKGIMIVHWGGYPHDMDRLKLIQKKCYDLYGFSPQIIEDCAHAWGSKYKNQLIGTHGNMAAFSFQAIKHFTTADGGLLITHNKSDYERAKLLRWYGLDRTGSADYRCAQNIQEWGYKFHMNDVNATLGIFNYPHVASLVKRHQENAAYIHQSLSENNPGGITLMKRDPGYESAEWIYTLRVERRDDFKRAMEGRGVATSQVHARNDTHDCLSEFRCALPNMDELNKDMICIPNGWWVTDEDRDLILGAIREGW